MSARKSFLLRLPPELHEQLRRWADDEMRSLNGHLEFVLRQALKQRGRLREDEVQDPESGEGGAQSDPPASSS